MSPFSLNFSIITPLSHCCNWLSMHLLLLDCTEDQVPCDSYNLPIPISVRKIDGWIQACW